MRSVKRLKRLLEAFAFETLAKQFAMATYRLGPLPCLLLGRLFEMPTEFHFTEDTFPLHLLLERAEGLVNVVVAYDYLHSRSQPF